MKYIFKTPRLLGGFAHLIKYGRFALLGMMNITSWALILGYDPTFGKFEWILNPLVKQLSFLIQKFG